MPELPVIEGFRILEELGSGAVSCVYKAVDDSLGRVVALKVLRSTIPASAPFAAQLEREARVLAELCHPNIGLLYAFSKTHGGIHLVLEFVDGFSLATLLKKRPTMRPECVAAIGAAVARGLAHAHSRAIVHRDIKPANILVSRQGEVKIFDFGIAQRAQAGEEPVGLSPMRVEDVVPFGTPAYMSPEQILGENVDARSDVFSLGVVLYQLTCGARPFERGDETDRRPAAHRIRREPPIPLHRRAPDVPMALERIIMRSIEKLPSERFQSAEAVAESLEELADASSAGDRGRLVMAALEHAGLVGAPEAASARAPVRRKRAPVRRAVVGLAALGASVVVGGGFLQASARPEHETAGAQPLELMPASPGYLRVLAIPWAEVWVDGQRIDVTPFARPIPLAAGTHYVTLVHPNAPVEKRTVAILAGEVRTVDAVLSVADPGFKEDAGAPEPRAGAEKKR